MKLKIDGNYYEGNSGETLMELAKRNNINIPNLCHKKDLKDKVDADYAWLKLRKAKN